MEKKKQQMGRKFWVAPKDVQETRQRSSMPSLLLPLSLARAAAVPHNLLLSATSSGYHPTRFAFIPDPQMTAQAPGAASLCVSSVCVIPESF